MWLPVGAYVCNMCGYSHVFISGCNPMIAGIVKCVCSACSVQIALFPHADEMSEEKLGGEPGIFCDVLSSGIDTIKLIHFEIHHRVDIVHLNAKLLPAPLPIVSSCGPLMKTKQEPSDR